MPRETKNLLEKLEVIEEIPVRKTKKSHSQEFASRILTVQEENDDQTVACFQQFLAECSQWEKRDAYKLMLRILNEWKYAPPISVIIIAISAALAEVKAKETPYRDVQELFMMVLLCLQLGVIIPAGCKAIDKFFTSKDMIEEYIQATRNNGEQVKAYAQILQFPVSSTDSPRKIVNLLRKAELELEAVRQEQMLERLQMEEKQERDAELIARARKNFPRE